MVMRDMEDNRSDLQLEATPTNAIMFPNSVPFLERKLSQNSVASSSSIPITSSTLPPEMKLRELEELAEQREFLMYQRIIRGRTNGNKTQPQHQNARIPPSVQEVNLNGKFLVKDLALTDYSSLYLPPFKNTDSDRWIAQEVRETYPEVDRYTDSSLLEEEGIFELDL